MLHEGISTSNVLDKMTNYSPRKNAKQLTKQDVYNVAWDYNVHELPHSNDLKSVDITVHKISYFII